MTLQNRVDPAGEIHAVPQRGLLMGNRGGCLHDDNRQLSSRRWVSGRWIICVLEFRDRKRTIRAPRRYTELFFLDEATALSAGHRPCFECQRERANEFWLALINAGLLSENAHARDIDDLVSAEIRSRMKRETDPRSVIPRELPDGALFRSDATYWLKWNRRAWPWSFAGYGEAQVLPDRGECMTPQATLAAFRAGYRPDVHVSIPD